MTDRAERHAHQTTLLNVNFRAKRDPSEAIFLKGLAASAIVKEITDNFFPIGYTELMDPVSSVIERLSAKDIKDLEMFMLHRSNETKSQNELASVAFRLCAAYFNAFKRNDLTSEFGTGIREAIDVGARICAENNLNPWEAGLVRELAAASAALSKST